MVPVDLAGWAALAGVAAFCAVIVAAFAWELVQACRMPSPRGAAHGGGEWLPRTLPPTDTQPLPLPLAEFLEPGYPDKWIRRYEEAQR